MFEGRPLTIVVPAYNEERLIGRVLDTMPSCVDRIVVVDDASSDGTVAQLEAALGRLGRTGSGSCGTPATGAWGPRSSAGTRLRWRRWPSTERASWP